MPVVFEPALFVPPQMLPNLRAGYVELARSVEISSLADSAVGAVPTASAPAGPAGDAAHSAAETAGGEAAAGTCAVADHRTSRAADGAGDAVQPAPASAGESPPPFTSEPEKGLRQQQQQQPNAAGQQPPEDPSETTVDSGADTCSVDEGRGGAAGSVASAPAEAAAAAEADEVALDAAAQVGHSTHAAASSSRCCGQSFGIHGNRGCVVERVFQPRRQPILDHVRGAARGRNHAK